MKNLCIIVFFFAANLIIAQHSPGCSSQSYALMDYWVGDWNVYENDELVGTNSIEKIVDGCAVLENWKSKFGQPGLSLFYIDNKTKTWKQIWVTGQSNKPWGQKEKSLIYHKKDSLLIFQGSYVVKQENYLDRTLLLKQSDTEVLQTIQISKDGGLTWETTFNAFYKRK
ncbi:hypothetical protein FVB32_08395 [Flagellimonas hymeniacidonis]|uniref:DUF1579 domain-containing protein n=1 Tax=Flagellimonas hymeniacidonis TaxID=2603628 RepID=A0A5C8VB29_9FLAO|nr:hypothetical protein [Flagellimonas hymeniacidonis]TXN38300.1 hypothetical protein FVB32_08395 [Flagellimonas hymeniacidonis]